MSDDRERIDRLEKRQDRFEDVHIETISEIGKLVTELRVTNENAKHISEDNHDLKVNFKDMSDRLMNVELQQAENKPMLEIVKNLNNKLWALIVTAIGGCMVVVYSLQSGG